MKKIVFLLSFLCLTNCLAQTPYLEWSKTYGGQEDDRLSDMIQLADGSLVMVGFAISSDGNVQQNRGGKDVWVIKTDSEGALLWEHTFGGSADEEATAIVLAEDGGFWVVGWSKSVDGQVGKNFGLEDAWLLKLSSDGALESSLVLGGMQKDQWSDIIKLNDKKYLLCGYTASDDLSDIAHIGKNDVWAVLMNEEGELLWSKNYGGSLNDVCNAAVFDQEREEMILVGSTASTDGAIESKYEGKDFWVIRLDMDGTLLRETTFGGNSGDVATDVILTKDGGLAVIGESLSRDGQVTDNQGNGDIWVIRLGENDELLWNKTLGSKNFETAYHILQTKNGDLLSIGATFSTEVNHTFNDLFLHQLDYETGDIIWELIVGGSEDDFALGAVNTDDGNFVLAGYTDSKDGDIIGDGRKQKHGAHDAWIIRLAATTVGIKGDSWSNQVVIFPTYTNNFFKIKVSETDNYFFIVNLFNTTGQTIMSQKVNCFQGVCEVPIAVDGLSNGVYFVEVCNGVDNCTTRKIVKVNAK